MQKIILITGSTDGIGLETAHMLVSQGHRVLLHGRNTNKLAQVEQTLCALPGDGCVESYAADLSNLRDVATLAEAIAKTHDHLDVVINNAGVFNTSEPVTGDGLDVRFVVNTIAPWFLTKQLLPLLNTSGRVVNLSSAAQAPVDANALAGKIQLSDGAAYAQSKLALTMCSRELALNLGGEGPAIIAVNPGSMLGSKMVKEAFGVAGGDLRKGARILVQAALDEEFSARTGQYFDNDSGQFASPHPDAFDRDKSAEIIRIIESVINAAKLLPA